MERAWTGVYNIYSACHILSKRNKSSIHFLVSSSAYSRIILHTSYFSYSIY